MWIIEREYTISMCMRLKTHTAIQISGSNIIKSNLIIVVKSANIILDLLEAENLFWTLGMSKFSLNSG